MVFSELGEKIEPMKQFVVDLKVTEGKQALDRLKM